MQFLLLLSVSLDRRKAAWYRVGTNNIYGIKKLVALLKPDS